MARTPALVQVNDDLIARLDAPEDGMPSECALTLDNLVTVLKSLLSERITRLPPARLAELCSAIDVATGCD